MYNVESRVWLSKDIYYNEWHFLYGDRKDEKVTFIYHNIKTGKDTIKPYWNYAYALSLARFRRSDGRYKNYEFHIM